jgi:hypothetical protein
VSQLAQGQRGNADLCTYFFLRAARLLREAGQLGFLATNTIAQGDTRGVGFDRVIADGYVIPRADPSRPWPGEASLEVARVWIRRGQWSRPFVLNDKPVVGITSFLSETGVVTGKPFRLKANEGRAFQGSVVLGMGFVLSLVEARQLIDECPRNKDVLFPYLNGEDLNSRPDLSASRWVINFFDWPLDRESAPDDYVGPVAADYPDCLATVYQRVKPERDKLGEKGDASARGYAKLWWQYGRKGLELYRTISGMERVIVVSLVSNKVPFAFVPTETVFAHKLAVIAFGDWATFALLQSIAHYHWAWHYCSTMRTDLNYSPSDAFEAFPVPTILRSHPGLSAIGEAYHTHRGHAMLTRQEGLTRIYNRFHAANESAADIQKLRDLHIEMDQALAGAYSWTDLDLDHGFHETKAGPRFTISESARREILARLLNLNHVRYAEEVEQGLHDQKSAGRGATRGKKSEIGIGQKKAGGRARKAKAASDGPSLNFGDDDEEPEPADLGGGRWLAGGGQKDENSDGTKTDVGSDTAATSRSTHQTRSRPSVDGRISPATHHSPPITEFDTDAIMAAFRQAARGRGWLERDELLKHVSLVLGYKRLGPKIDESLRGHCRAAIRRRIIEADGPSLVHAGTGTMSDYGLDELRETFRSVMRKGTICEREDVVHALASYLGFLRVTDSIRQPIKSAINGAIRQGLLGYEGSVIWREE